MTLLIKKNQTEYLESKVFAEISPVGRDEFMAAGQKGLKPSCKVEMWESEYENQEELLLEGKKYSVYRTYGPKRNEKIELYVAERIGKN